MSSGTVFVALFRHVAVFGLAPRPMAVGLQSMSVGPRDTYWAWIK